MPISPENKGRYPKNWKAIRLQILGRAKHRCEQCYVPNHSFRHRENGEVRLRMPKSWLGNCTMIVLTIAHLDHTPENCDPANLRAWCQKCHLAYDHAHHQQNAAARRRSGKAAGDLFPT